MGLRQMGLAKPPGAYLAGDRHRHRQCHPPRLRNCLALHLAPVPPHPLRGQRNRAGTRPMGRGLPRLRPHGLLVGVAVDGRAAQQYLRALADYQYRLCTAQGRFHGACQLGFLDLDSAACLHHGQLGGYIDRHGVPQRRPEEALPPPRAELDDRALWTSGPPVEYL
jgi:hypothetical protein